MEQIEKQLSMLDGMTCIAQVWQPGGPDARLELRRLGKLTDVMYSFGQMVCLVAAQMKRKYEQRGLAGAPAEEARGWTVGQWLTSDATFPTNVSIEEIHQQVGMPGSDLVYAAALAYCRGRSLPLGDRYLSGYGKAREAMACFGDMFFVPSRVKGCALDDAKAQSLAFRLDEEKAVFACSGRVLHNEALFNAIHRVLGRVQLVNAHDINI